MITGYVAFCSILGENLFWAVLMTRLYVSGTSRTNDAWKPSMRTNTLLPLWVCIVLQCLLQSTEPETQIFFLHLYQLKLSTKLGILVLDSSEVLCYVYFNQVRTDRNFECAGFFRFCCQCCTLDKDVNCQGVLEPFTTECVGIWGGLYCKCLPSKTKKRGVGKAKQSEKIYFELLGIGLGRC